MDTIRIRRGDTSPLYYTIKDLELETSDYPARDLTDCTINLYLYADEIDTNIEGRVKSSTSTTIQLDDEASSYDNDYVGKFITIYDGTGNEQTRTISAYDGNTKTATISIAWATLPDTTSRYRLIVSEAGYLIEGGSCVNLTDVTTGLTRYDFPTVDGTATENTGMFRIWWNVTDENGATKRYPYQTQWLHIYDDIIS